MFEKLRQCLALYCMWRMLWEMGFQIHRHYLDRENESVHEGIVTVPVLLSKLFVIMHDESSLSHNVVDEK